MAENRLASAILQIRDPQIRVSCERAPIGLLAGPARADENLDFYKGKIVRLVNGGSAGSGYDLYSRMLAPWFEKKLGATRRRQSRPGAGMMTAMNHVGAAAPDGLTMMLAPGEGAVLAKLVDDPALRFDLKKYGLLARVNTAPRVLIVNPNSPYKSVDDLFKQTKPLQIGANGKTDAASDASAVFCHALKIQCKITIGYKSSNDFSMAAIRGEVDGTILVEDSSARYAQGGQLRGVVVTARERSRLMPDVPTVDKSVKLDPEATWWLDFREDVRKVGRLLIVPPGAWRPSASPSCARWRRTSSPIPRRRRISPPSNNPRSTAIPKRSARSSVMWGPSRRNGARRSSTSSWRSTIERTP